MPGGSSGVPHGGRSVGTSVAVCEAVPHGGRPVMDGIVVAVRVRVRVAEGVRVRVTVGVRVGWILTAYTMPVGVPHGGRSEGKAVGVTLGAVHPPPGFCGTGEGGRRVGKGVFVAVGVKVLVGVTVNVAVGVKLAVLVEVGVLELAGVAEGCGAMLAGPAVMVIASVASSH